MTYIIISYTCKGCGTTRKPLSVPERGIDDDVVVWAKYVTKYARHDHAERQPTCPQDWFDVYLPLSEDETMIGRK